MIKKEKNFKKALNEYLEKTINTNFNSASDARTVAAKYSYEKGIDEKW